MLDSSAEDPVFKSQPRRCRVTVLGKLFTPIVCQAAKLVTALLMVAGVTAGVAESNGCLLPNLWRDSLHVTCGLTACTPGSAPGPTLGNEYGKLYLLPG